MVLSISGLVAVLSAVFWKGFCLDVFLRIFYERYIFVAIIISCNSRQDRFDKIE